MAAAYEYLNMGTSTEYGVQGIEITFAQKRGISSQYCSIAIPLHMPVYV